MDSAKTPKWSDTTLHAIRTRGIILKTFFTRKRLEYVSKVLFFKINK